MHIVLLFSRGKQRKKFDIKSIRKILIIDTNNIGDFFFTLPSIKAIKEKFPGAEINVMVWGEVSSLAEKNDWIDKVRVYEKKGMIRKIKNVLGLRREKFDLVINMQISFWKIILTYLLNPDYSIGHDIRDFGFLLSKSIKLEYKYWPNVYLDLVKDISKRPLSNKITWKVDKKDREFINNYLLKKDVRKSDFMAGVHAGVGEFIPQKKWENKKFAELCDILQERYGLKVLLVGAPSEKEMIDDISRKMHTKSVKIFDLGIDKLPALIRRYNLFIGVDSAPLHIATTLDIPVVVLLGPQDQKKILPIKENIIIVRKNVGCNPCFKEEKLLCKDNICMKSIEVGDVTSAVKRQLE